MDRDPIFKTNLFFFFFFFLVPIELVQQVGGTRVMAIFYLPGTNTGVGVGGIVVVDFDLEDTDVAVGESKRGCVVSLFI